MKLKLSNEDRSSMRKKRGGRKTRVQNSDQIDFEQRLWMKLFNTDIFCLTNKNKLSQPDFFVSVWLTKKLLEEIAD